MLLRELLCIGPDVTLQHADKTHLFLFVSCFHITPHKRNGTVFVVVCIPNIPLFVFRFQTSRESVNTDIFNILPVWACCSCPSLSFCPIQILNTKSPVSSFLVVLRAYFSTATYTEKNRSRTHSSSSSSSVKGESRKGGRRRSEAEGEGNTTQTELCLTSLLPERRKG